MRGRRRKRTHPELKLALLLYATSILFNLWAASVWVFGRSTPGQVVGSNGAGTGPNSSASAVPHSSSRLAELKEQHVAELVRMELHHAHAVATLQQALMSRHKQERADHVDCAERLRERRGWWLTDLTKAHDLEVQEMEQGYDAQRVAAKAQGPGYYEAAWEMEERQRTEFRKLTEEVCLEVCWSG